MSDFHISHISDEELAKWVRSKPSVVKEFITEREGEPALRRMGNPPLHIEIEYFWFDGGIYRREGPKGNLENRRWERYSDDILSGKRAWWFWKELPEWMASELDKLYEKVAGVG